MGLRSKGQAAARPTAGIALSRTEWRELRSLAQRAANDPWALGARIVLSAARGSICVDIARTLNIKPGIVYKCGAGDSWPSEWGRCKVGCGHGHRAGWQRNV